MLIVEHVQVSVQWALFLLNKNKNKSKNKSLRHIDLGFFSCSTIYTGGLCNMSRKEQEVMREMKRRWANKCSEGELYCFLCGKIIENMKECNADHWIPRALGGKTTEDNLKPAHKSCNSKKGCLSPEEFLAHKEEILSKTYVRDKKRKK